MVSEPQKNTPDRGPHPEEILAAFDSLLADAPVGVAFFDREHRYVRLNRSLAESNGLPVETHLGRPIAELLPETAHAVDPILERVFVTGEPVLQVEVAGETPAAPGRLRHWLTSFYPVRAPDGAVAWVGAVVVEITGRKQTEEERERLLKTLEIERARFAVLFQQAPAFMATLRGPDHVFELTNPMYDQLVGSRDVRGKPARQALPEVEGQGFFELLDQVYATGVPFVGNEARILLQSQEEGPLAERFLNFVYQPLLGVDGRVVGIFSHGVDVTDQVRARQRVEALAELNRTMTDNATSCLFMTDAEGRCTFMNPAAERVTGHTFAEIRGRPLHNVIHHKHPDGTPYPIWDCPLDRALPQNHQIRAHEDVFIRKDGTFFPVLCAASPIVENGVPVGTVLEVRDITEEKRAREAIRENEERLRAALAASQQAEEALKEADRRKNEFLAMLGHELRNPLAPIRNAVAVLRLQRDGDPLLHRAEEMIDRQVTHMARLVDDLLDVSRISRGKILLRKERLDLVELVRAVVEDHRAGVEESGLALALDLPDQPLWVDGDPTRLAQALGNLLHNAGKFTDTGGGITVAVQRDPVHGCAEVAVQDTGIGMEPEMVGRLFETFSQADHSLDRSRGGLGLGLALVKGLVDLHGGRVMAASEGLGRGSRFTLCLPLAAAPVPAGEPAPAGRATGALHVLIIEDHPDAAESMQMLLQLYGHEAEIALDGPAGLAAARRFRPDVVLCDIGLPGGMDGYAVARAVRADPELRALRLIALTGYGQEEDQARSHEAGFDLHLTKPVDPAALEKLLGGR
jgi:PAS domain S-box-containing protein